MCELSMKYKWSSTKNIEKLSKNTFGNKLSKKVAKKLRSILGQYDFFYSHKDYCGHGIWFNENSFELCIVSDGYPDKRIMKWDNENDFIMFLSKQSDYTCSGADINEKLFYTSAPWELNNQRLTEERLKDFVNEC